MSIAHLSRQRKAKISAQAVWQYGIHKFLYLDINTWSLEKLNFRRVGSKMNKKNDPILAECLKRKIAIPPSRPRVGAHLWADEASLVSF